MLATHVIINVDCFSDTHRITGRAQVAGNNGLLGLMNDPNASLIEVENAYLSRLQEPAKIESHFERVSLNKHTLAFVVVNRREELGSTAYARGGFVQIAIQPIALVLPAYEIRGQIEMPGKFDITALLGSSGGQYLPIYKTTIHAVLFANAPFTGEAIAVNRARVEALAIIPKGKA